MQLLAALPQYTVGKLPIIKAVVSSMDPQQLYRIVYEITAKRIRFIGNQISVSFIMATFDWDSFEQQNFWQIAISEALIQLSLRDSFCTALIDLFSNWQSKGIILISNASGETKKFQQIIQKLRWEFCSC